MKSPMRANMVGMTKGWASNGKTDVADEGFIKNFVDSDSVVDCPDWFTNNASALAGGKNV